MWQVNCLALLMLFCALFPGRIGTEPQPPAQRFWECLPKTMAVAPIAPAVHALRAVSKIVSSISCPHLVSKLLLGLMMNRHKVTRQPSVCVRRL